MSNQLASCPVCNSSKIAYWGKTSGRITLHDSWWRCKECTVLFANPIRTAEEIKSFYAHEFYEEKHIDESKSEYQKLFHWLTELIVKWKKPENVMEIGCGKGLFLKYFTQIEKPKTAVGIEFDKSVTDKIQLGNTTAFTAYNDYYENIQFQQKFDLIFFWHVIEHVIDVHAFLEKIKFDMREDGIAVMGTPAFGLVNSFKAYIQKFLGKTVTVGTSSDHTFFFSDRVLKRILQKHGFEVVFQKVYIDNVNDEMNFSKNRIKSLVLSILQVFMKITRLPLFGKQIVIIRKPKVIQNAI